MSHNTIKVSSKTANRDNEITLNLSDVSSVSSPADSEIFGYNGTSWINRAPNWVNAYEESAHSYSIQIGVTNASTILLNYPNAPARFYRFYNKQTTGTGYANFSTTSDVSLLEEATGTTIWYYGFKFNTAGVYRITAKMVAGPNSTDTSFVDLQLSNSTNSVKYSPKFRIGNVNVKQRNIVGIVNASVNDEVGFYKHAIINSPKYAQLGDTNILVTIERLS